MKKLVYLLVAVMCLALFSCSEEEEVTPNEQITEDVVTNESEDVIQESPASDFTYKIGISDLKGYVAITGYVGTSEHVVVPKEIDGLPVTSLAVTHQEDNTVTGTFEGSKIKTIVLPESIEIVNGLAFKDCKELVEVTLPKSIVYIDEWAFMNCEKLEKIDCSHTKLKRIFWRAFENCVALKSVMLSDCIEFIGENAFYNCSSLEEMHFPESLTKIDNGAFNYCTSLKRINIPPKLSLYANEIAVFVCNDSLETVIIEPGREVIEGYLFFVLYNNCEVIIPESVKKISFDAFMMFDNAKLVFLGDCPEMYEKYSLSKNLIICYDPNTNGWDNCPWKETYTFIPMT